ncbi:unnamed protein product [Rotaria sordida]|uniref:Macro domain-containing protein n=1 Tax=Rotaria sordida TaxID=392033 RepID=A0A814N9L4_9BILA|nr:unnamed protein product [Rotaria sordida]CAF1090505.1 unnamed protein product [Rotaria sordida]CAF1459269.1 unnamed protein product [Rotaria sordida]
MADSSRPFTPFNRQSNETTAKSSIPAINFEGLSSIESTAIARQAKHYEIKSSNKNIEIHDYLFQRQQPTTTIENTCNTMQSTSISLPTTFTAAPVTYNKTTYPSENAGRPLTAKSRLPTQSYKIPRDKQYTKFFQHDRFCESLQLALIEQFSVQVQIMNARDNYSDANVAYTVVLSGSQVQTSNKDSIMMIRQNNCMLLFGLAHLVKSIIAEHEKLKPKLVITQIELNLQDYQIEYLLGMFQNELQQLEEQNASLQIFNGIKNRFIAGPSKTIDAVKEKLNQMVTTIQRKQFIIDDIRFSSLAVVEEKHLVEIGLAHKCLSKTEFESTEKIYSAPIPSFDRSANGFTPSAMSIDIRTGDLAEQSVDTVVVCSTSQYLLNDILDKAGTSIKNQVIEALQNGQITYNGYETSGGQLFCQRLLFVPWTTQKLDDRNLRQSIHIFFTTAIIHALNTQQTSIAFPALGCGELKYDPKLIAEVILDETQRYANFNLKILIVLLPNKNEAYEAFCVKLAELRQRKTAINPTRFRYPYKITKVILIGSEENMKSCQKAVQDHVHKCVQTEECDEFPLHTWDQATIDIFYKYCFEQHVIPEVNSTNEKLQLAGPKDKVMDTKTEFYRMKSRKAEESRIASYARIAIWVYETTTGTIEKYSLKLNALIEEAFSNNRDSVRTVTMSFST